MENNRKKDQKVRKQEKGEVAFYNDQLGENPSEGRWENIKHEKRKK